MRVNTNQKSRRKRRGFRPQFLMTELTEELFIYAEDAVETHGEDALHGDAAKVVPIDDVIDLLLPEPDTSVQALHAFIEDEDDRLDPQSRRNFVKALLRAAEGLPGLLPLLQDPVLQKLI